MSTCPACGRPVLQDARTCPSCGTPLGPGTGGLTLPPPPSALPGEEDRPLRLSHTGDRYVLGYGRDSFGIWERADLGRPVRRFPRTDEGWREAWAAYVAMEPNPTAVGPSAVPLASGPGPSAPGPPRVNGAWWLLPILLGWIGGLIAYFVNREADPATARAMLLVGIALSLVGALLLATLPTIR